MGYLCLHLPFLASYQVPDMPGYLPFPQKSILALHASFWKQATILSMFEQSIVPYLVTREISLFHAVSQEHSAGKPADPKQYGHHRNGYCLGHFYTRNIWTCALKHHKLPPPPREFHVGDDNPSLTFLLHTALLLFPHLFLSKLRLKISSSILFSTKIVHVLEINPLPIESI